MTDDEMEDCYKVLYPDTIIVNGPYYRNSDNRRFVSITKKQGKTTKQYCRYKMEVHLGRRLTKDETVDHKDRDYLNDDIDNLQILSRSDHGKKDAKRRLPAFANCKYCGIEFELSRDQIASYNRKKKQNGPFCSKKCAGRYGTDIQNNRNGLSMEREQIDIQYDYVNFG